MTMPQWPTPENLQQLVADEGGVWDVPGFDLPTLTIMADTSYKARQFPLVWQVSFSAGDQLLAPAAQRWFGADAEPDGYAWQELIADQFAKQYPALADNTYDDSEQATFVMWTGDEQTGRALYETVWNVLFKAS